MLAVAVACAVTAAYWLVAMRSFRRRREWWWQRDLLLALKTLPLGMNKMVDAQRAFADALRRIAAHERAFIDLARSAIASPVRPPR